MTVEHPAVRHGGAARTPSSALVVAIVSWNTRDLLDHCLATFRPKAESGLAEVWVVDNASTDGSADMVRERHPWVRLIASKDNLGYGPAVNLVARRTSSPWLAVSNADVALHPEALERLIAAGEAHDDVGIIAPRLILPDGSTQHSVWPFPDLAPIALANLGRRLTPTALGDRYVLRHLWRQDRARHVPWAIAAFIVVRREAWDQVGGFDDDQWMSAEDLDLGWRMAQTGWATRYEPSAVLDHAESAAVSQRWGAELPIHWQRCAYAWMVRRRGRPRAVAVGTINFAGAVARLLFYGAMAAGPRRSWRARLRPQLAWTMVHAYALAPRRTLRRYR